ncbi:MAG: enoyl-CoA hydratase/isomerase family protein [Acidimicrobiales bacterium]
MADLETITYEAQRGVAWVTLNRPEVHNAFNAAMQHELQTVWRWVRRDDTVRAVVLTGAGEKAFCTGIDRSEVLGDARETNAGAAGGSGSGPDPGAGPEPVHVGSGTTPFMFDDPGERLGPKSNDLWKPVIAAVNGMACGGAFYMLGEVDIIVAADHATFFDPHVSYGMAAGFEPLQLLPKMPFGEIVRLTLLGNAERMSAGRAHQIGLVSEVCPASELRLRAGWVAEQIARAPALAVQGTLRALWAGRELSRGQALGLGWAFVGLGTDQESLAEGQAAFASGVRTTPRIR